MDTERNHKRTEMCVAELDELDVRVYVCGKRRSKNIYLHIIQKTRISREGERRRHNSSKSTACICIGSRRQRNSNNNISP